MVNVFTIHHMYAPLLVIAVSWLVLGPLLGVALPAPHRKRGPAKVGRKIPPPVGRHADTQPIPLPPVTAIEGIPLHGLLVPARDTVLVDVTFDELVAGKSPFVPLEPSTGPVYLRVPGRGRRRVA